MSSEVVGNGLGNGNLVILSGYGSNFSPSLRRLPPLFWCCWCAWYVSTSFPMRATCQAACVFIYIKTIVPVPVLLFLTVPCADLRPERFRLLRDTSFFVITKLNSAVLVYFPFSLVELPSALRPHSSL